MKKIRSKTFQGAIIPLIDDVSAFFMVVADKPMSIPLIKHLEEVDALQEAIRISNKEKCECYVMKCTQKVKLIPHVTKIN
jgi:hypothetical protein